MDNVQFTIYRCVKLIKTTGNSKKVSTITRDLMVNKFVSRMGTYTDWNYLFTLQIWE